MLKKAIEFFIPFVPDANGEYQRRVRLITYAVFITTLFSLFYVGISLIAAYWMGAMIMFAGFIIFAVLLFLLKSGLNIFVIANIFGFAGIVSITGCIYFSGGLSSPVLPWLATTPIVILLLAGKKSGTLWAVVSVLITLVFTAMTYAGYVFPKDLSVENIAFNVSCHAGLILIIFFISIVFENVRIRAFNIVSSQKDELQKTLKELKSTQAQLIQSEKMASLGELTAGIAHEIQNPLNFVNNFSELNRELAGDLKNELKAGNSEEAINILNDMIENEEKIKNHGLRAGEIVKGMLQHSGKSAGQKELTDINALCDECLRLSYRSLQAKNKSFIAELKTDFDKSLEKINIISQDISRVLLNLLSNAFYAVDTAATTKGKDYKPLITITTRKINFHSGGMGAEIKLSDNGTGIPKKIVDKIFQPFFTTKPTGKGTGLGLSLSYDIITKAHGGVIQVETEEGVGSDFIIQLPYI